MNQKKRFLPCHERVEGKSAKEWGDGRMYFGKGNDETCPAALGFLWESLWTCHRFLVAWSDLPLLRFKQQLVLIMLPLDS